MKRMILGAVAAAALMGTVAPASADYCDWHNCRGGWGRDRVIVQERSGVSNGTLITLFALQALQAAQAQPKVVEEPYVERAPARKYAPLK